MSISDKSMQLLTRLAALAATEPAELSKSDVLGVIKTGRLPRASTATEEEAGWLILTGEDLDLYYACLGSLTSEPELEHITRRDIDRELWELVLQCSARWQEYQRPEKRSDRLSDFLGAVTKTHELYEVMFDVKHLAIKDGLFKIGDVSFVHLDSEAAKAWGIADQPSYMRIVADLTDSPVAVVTVEAGSSLRALEKAKELVDTALNVLRVCVSGYRGYHLWDEQLLQRRGTLQVVKTVSSSQTVLPAWERGFAARDLNLAGPLLSSASEVAEKLQVVFDSEFPKRLREKSLRALEWIGTSVTREHLDDKVVDLCTALECVLTGRDDVKKGEPISLRMMLLAMKLDRTFVHPGQVLRWYELRSDIIHGSDRGACARADYLGLRSVTLRILLNVIDLGQNTEGIYRISDLIGIIEDPQLLGQAISWLDQWADPNTGAVKRYAQARLERLTTN